MTRKLGAVSPCERRAKGPVLPLELSVMMLVILSLAHKYCIIKEMKRVSNVANDTHNLQPKRPEVKGTARTQEPKNQEAKKRKGRRRGGEEGMRDEMRNEKLEIRNLSAAAATLPGVCLCGGAIAPQ
jgi:hypothetical protein